MAAATTTTGSRSCPDSTCTNRGARAGNRRACNKSQKTRHLYKDFGPSHPVTRPSLRPVGLCCSTIESIPSLAGEHGCHSHALFPATREWVPPDQTRGLEPHESRDDFELVFLRTEPAATERHTEREKRQQCGVRVSMCPCAQVALTALRSEPVQIKFRTEWACDFAYFDPLSRSLSHVAACICTDSRRTFGRLLFSNGLRKHTTPLCVRVNKLFSLIEKGRNYNRVSARCAV